MQTSLVFDTEIIFQNVYRAIKICLRRFIEFLRQGNAPKYNQIGGEDLSRQEIAYAITIRWNGAKNFS